MRREVATKNRLFRANPLPHTNICGFYIKKGMKKGVESGKKWKRIREIGKLNACLWWRKIMLLSSAYSKLSAIGIDFAHTALLRLTVGNLTFYHREQKSCKLKKKPSRIQSKFRKIQFKHFLNR